MNSYWIHCAVWDYLQNRLTTRSRKSLQKTPFELWHSRKPDVADLHVFGCDAYVHIPKQKRVKLNFVSEKLTFIGYSHESKAYRFIDKVSGKITVSRDAKFLEQVSPTQVSKSKIVETPQVNIEYSSSIIVTYLDTTRRQEIQIDLNFLKQPSIFQCYW